MPKALTEAELERYRQDGYLFPIRVLSEDEAAHYRRKIEAFESDVDGRRRIDRRYLKTDKLHLLFTWANELVRHPKILDIAEDVVGLDLMCWGNSCWIKEPQDPGFVSWHQDSTYWGLEPPDVVSVWLALADATVENGAMQFLPGSHLRDQIPHRVTDDADNLLSRGQVAEVDVDESQVVDAVLQAGEVSIHHIRLLHGSKPNVSDTRRIGFAIRYIPSHVRHRTVRDSVKLVRGEDRYGHFEMEPDPVADLDAAALASHNEAVDLPHRRPVGGPIR